MNLQQTKYPDVYELWKGNKRLLVTPNLTPGTSFFKEHLFENGTYREWDCQRSKVAAALVKKINFLGIKKGDKVLYLGAAHGYTASFVSDIVGETGFIYALDFAARVVRDLYFVCEARKNMAPLLADASKPDTYRNRIEKVDVIIQDIAQKQQVEILFKNLQFLKPHGYILLAVKSRSIDVTRKPANVFKEVELKLKEKLKIIDSKDLSPLEKDHMFFLCQIK